MKFIETISQTAEEEEESNQSESQSQFVQDFSTSDDTNNTEMAVEGSWLN